MDHDINEITKFYESLISVNNRDLFMRELKYSGYALLDKIEANLHILDIGCGQNLFKKHFPNLIGIDPATDQADIKITFQDYQPTQKFDVALCLGSIQGSDSQVREQISKICALLTEQGRIFWRCMPNPPPYVVPAWMSLWTFERHQQLAQEFGFEIVELYWDSRPQPEIPISGLRIYAQWRRLSA